jgi:hypothetical protein
LWCADRTKESERLFEVGLGLLGLTSALGKVGQVGVMRPAFPGQLLNG